jgi:hypothetical protein
MNPSTDDTRTSHPDTWSEPAAAAAERWHRAAAKRDEAYLAQGPVDMTETTDPYGPWAAGPEPDAGEVDVVEETTVALEAGLVEGEDEMTGPAWPPTVWAGERVNDTGE